MSIFPKKITLGENCIIHLKFANSGENNEIIKYVLKVTNPNNEVILDINKSIILGVAEKKDFIREIYYNVQTTKFNSQCDSKEAIYIFWICHGMEMRSRS